MGQARNWTQEEDDYLAENYGTISISTIAKKLNRSVEAINIRRTKKGLGAFLDNGRYISYSQFLQALYGIDSAMIAWRHHKSWVEFPVKKKKVNNCSFKVVYLEEFWEWAKEHKRLIDFTKMEEGALGWEPEWAKKKRRIDLECRVKKSPWTKSEDWLLQHLLKAYKYTYTDLASRLNRTEGAIKRRIYDLGLKERPMRNENRPWTDEEKAILIFMYDEGWSFEKIGEKLKRSALGCRGKVEHLENQDEFLRVNRRA